MNAIDILNSPWAITPSRLEEIQAIYAAHARGERSDLAEIEARMGRPLANERQPYTVRDGVAILSAEGVIAKKMNLFSAISGGTSSQLLGSDIREALADAAVHSIILNIDSPGGTVDGTQALASAIYAARGEKRIVAFADGMMASAAYWIGSGADEIYAADPTTQVGSIGVVAKHVDVSGAEAQAGMKTTEITAGKYKRSASQYGPLTDQGRTEIQASVDYIYSLFVEDVAKHRGVSTEKVLADMADGRVFTGRQAEAAGLVDGITSLDALVAQLNQKRPAKTAARRTVTATAGVTMPFTKEQVLAESPEVANAFIAQGREEERGRIAGIDAAIVPGHDELVAKMRADGKSTAGDVALAILAAEKADRSTAAKALADESPGAVHVIGQPNVTQLPAKGELSRSELDAKAQAHAEKHGVSYLDAVKAVQAAQRRAA